MTRIRALAVLCIVAGIAGAAHAQPFGASPSPADHGGIAHWMLLKQAEFYRMLAGAIRAAKLDGSAAWGLLGISFLYGVLHAAGPGHGKAVISSYLVANNDTWRRGVALSFASALLQAVVAVAIVGVMAILLGATGKMMGDAVRVIEIVSYALIALVGVRLLWVKGRAFVRALRPTPHAHHDHSYHGHAHCGHDHHHHDHADEASAWSHAHAPEPAELAGPGGWRRGLSAVVAVGMRPCSGAIVVLVFALAQGIFLTGIGATLAMGLGTAITVTAIATLAVMARGAAGRFAAAKPGIGLIVLRGLETAAAALVLIFGVLLLAGYLASERLPGI